MADEREQGEVLDLSRAGEQARRRRQDQAAQELATRFHRAMGWKGAPDQPKGRKSKPRKKKR